MPKRNSKTDSPTANEPVYFLSLEVESVRCFGPKQRLDLSDGNGRPAQWTILLGNNGTGKTTVLQCLASCNQYQFGTGTTEGDSPNLTSRFLLDPRCGDLWRYPPTSVAEHVDEMERTRRSTWPVVRTKIALGTALQSTSPTPETGFIQMHGRIEKTSDNFGEFCCIAYGAGRRIGTSSLSSTDDSDACATLFDDHATVRNAEDWLLQTDYAASKSQDRKRRERLEQVRDILLRILPDTIDLRFQPAADGRIAVEFKTPYGWVPLRRMSYGYQTLIAWMVDFASRMVERYPKSPDPLKEPAIVLVDEIDLHLHPSWQRILMQYLTERFPNTQFIVTAHSPLIVQAAPSVNANLAVLRREGDHVVIDNDVDAIRGWRVDQILTSELFDLPTARPAEFDRDLKRRTELLSKARLTKADRKELTEIDSRLGQLPAGETADQSREILDLVRQTHNLLKEPGGAT
jgi:energy-coupling factor transporter ATP-binding protein EcfA2